MSICTSLDGVYVDEPNLCRSCQIASGSGGIYAVDGDVVAVAPATVDGEDLMEIVGIEVVEVSSNDPGLQQGKVDGVASVQGKVGYLAGFYRSADLSCFTLDLDRGGSDGD